MNTTQINEMASSKLLRALEHVAQAQEILGEKGLVAQIADEYGPDRTHQTTAWKEVSDRAAADVTAAQGCLRGARAIIWPEYLA